MPFQNWSSADWTFTGLLFDILGAFILVKGLLFNRFSREEAGTYLSYNPYLMRGNLEKKLDAIIGFVFLILGFIFQGVGSLKNFFSGTAGSAIFNSSYSSGFFFFKIALIVIFAILAPSKIGLYKYRRENSKQRLERIRENIAEAQSGYLRKDLREMEEEKRSKISNLQEIIGGTTDSIKNNIDQTEKLFQIRGKGVTDLERLQNIEIRISKWI